MPEGRDDVQFLMSCFGRLWLRIFPRSPTEADEQRPTRLETGDIGEKLRQITAGFGREVPHQRRDISPCRIVCRVGV